MSDNILFALDTKTEEIIISESPKGSNKIKFLERISRRDNENLYYSVIILTNITKDSNFDVSIFKAVDKVCQLLYKKDIESR